MVKYSSSVIVPFARERVWKLMSDWTYLSAWDVNISKSQLSSGQKAGQVGVGTKYYCEFSANGMSDVPVNYECMVFDAPNKCQYVGLAKLFKSVDTVECAPEGDNATKITASFNLSFRGLLSPFSFVMNGAMQKTGPVVMQDIEKFVATKLSEESAN